MTYPTSHRKHQVQIGQGLTEYALILVLVAVVVIIIIGQVGTAVSENFQNITCSLEMGANCTCTTDEVTSERVCSPVLEVADNSGDPSPADATTPPPADATTPPPADATTPPPADATTPPPADATTPPPADATTPPPADATTPPPADGGGGGGGAAPTNNAPLIGSVGDQTVDEGSSKTVSFLASDPDGDSLVYSTYGLVGSFMTFTDQGNGAASLVLTPGYSHQGSYLVVVSVGDGNGGIAQVEVRVTVNNIEQDAELDGIADAVDNCPNTANAGQEDRDNDQVGDACDYTYLINIGAVAGTQTDSNGNVWQPETGISSTNGSVYRDSAGNAIANTDDDFIYQTSAVARSGSTGKNLQWEISNLPSGTYTVYLYFAEVDSAHRAQFHIYVQGTRIERNYRPDAPGLYTASVVTSNNHSVTNGTLTVLLTSRNSRYTRLSGVRIVGTPPGG